MKSSYVKPSIEFEEYHLNEAIASGCNARPNMYTYASCYSETILPTDEECADYTNHTIDPDTAVEQGCYHSASASSLFRS